jgi:hypothetical protein
VVLLYDAGEIWKTSLLMMSLNVKIPSGRAQRRVDMLRSAKKNCKRRLLEELRMDGSILLRGLGRKQCGKM